MPSSARRFLIVPSLSLTQGIRAVAGRAKFSLCNLSRKAHHNKIPVVLKAGLLRPLAKGSFKGVECSQKSWVANGELQAQPSLRQGWVHVSIAQHHTQCLNSADTRRKPTVAIQQASHLTHNLAIAYSTAKVSMTRQARCSKDARQLGSVPQQTR